MSNQDHLYIHNVNDGTPHYNDVVLNSFRKLQVVTRIYDEPVSRGAGLRVAIYQAQADWGEGAAGKNIQRLELAVQKAKAYGTQLLLFPELYLQGYTHDPESAKETSETCDGPSITRCREVACDNNIGLVVPYGERVDKADGKSAFYDSIAVIGENGDLFDSYRKTHLYGQQERDNWDVGDSDFPVHRFFDFPVGVINCYECEFPELVRILALKGAKLIVGPTAADTYYRLPSGDRSRVPYPDTAKIMFPGHAYANNLFFAYANRCGYEERDGDVWHYRGNSAVYGPHGDEIVRAQNEQDTLLVTDCVPCFYGMTHPAPDYFYLKDRRPELYQQLVSKEAKFLKTRDNNINEKTDLNAGDFRYP
ncbi:nitrilase-related carbon-nitrogen hydrolase [Rubellicoccus peritrichatus]|uniref:Nitrilase-related carbon-nitrogen hydrolase n=1 Tax=Rubellicoccus peritrichatus TaxID=3080537 RepID=A0AAQ3LAC8_9BACT|nr:nitrilase-related carbon-nitrogen hydrolase [Puniceicoccus sp. CR14]WOO40300.1 nitrilase-related carbon-nitrogen hydrolase [Puniceicoccus sp. CR14]